MENNDQPQIINPKTNGKAIAALVLGIVSLIIPYIGLIIGIIAIVYAKKAFVEIELNKDGGKGLAIAGLVCGIVAVSLYAILILLILVAGGLAATFTTF